MAIPDGLITTATLTSRELPEVESATGSQVRVRSQGEPGTPSDAETAPENGQNAHKRQRTSAPADASKNPPRSGPGLRDAAHSPHDSQRQHSGHQVCLKCPRLQAPRSPIYATLTTHLALQIDLKNDSGCGLVDTAISCAAIAAARRRPHRCRGARVAVAASRQPPCRQPAGYGYQAAHQHALSREQPLRRHA